MQQGAEPEESVNKEPGSGSYEMATGPHEVPVIHTHIAYFVVPLSEPLGFPDKQVVRFRAPIPDDVVRRHEDEDLPPPPQTHVASSLMFHRVRSPSPFTNDVDQLFELARRLFPDPDATGSAGSAPDMASNAALPPLMADRTFVEVAVAFDLDDDSSDAGISDTGLAMAFDRGLAMIREVQRAYYLISRRPMRLATRETMPVAVPYGIRRLVNENGDPEPFHVPHSMLILHDGMARDVRDPGMDSAVLDRFSGALWQLSSPGFLTDYLEFVREAQVALHHEGSSRAAVLFTATACEVLLDNLLGHMLWEEGERPEDAAKVFNNTTITNRVKKHYAKRLPAAWSVDEPGCIHNWFRDVACLRNRVIHSGYEPTMSQARQAQHSAAALAEHLAHLVAAQASTYPRTALVLPGKEGLQRRGKWTAQIEELQTDPNQVNWVETYHRWRRAMQRGREDGPEYVVPTVEASIAYAVMTADGELQRIIHDPTAGLAAAIEADKVSGLNATQLATLDKLRAAGGEAGPGNRFATRIAGATVTAPSSEVWVPEYRLVPKTGVMVDGKDLDLV